MSAREIHVPQLNRLAFVQYWGQEDVLFGTTQESGEEFEG